MPQYRKNELPLTKGTIAAPELVALARLLARRAAAEAVNGASRRKGGADHAAGAAGAAGGPDHGRTRAGDDLGPR